MSRYRSATSSPGMAANVANALLVEAQACLASEDVTGAVTACKRVMAWFGDYPDPEVKLAVADSLVLRATATPMLPFTAVDLLGGAIKQVNEVLSAPVVAGKGEVRIVAARHEIIRRLLRTTRLRAALLDALDQQAAGQAELSDVLDRYAGTAPSIELQAELVRTWVALATILARRGQVEAALDAISQAIGEHEGQGEPSVRSEIVEALMLRGDLLLKKPTNGGAVRQNQEAAIEAFQHVVDLLAGTMGSPRAFRARLSIASLHQQMGERKLASREYKRIDLALRREWNPELREYQEEARRGSVEAGSGKVASA